MRFVKDRASLLTGRIDIAVTSYTDGSTGSQERTTFETVRLAGQENIVIRRGDTEGIVVRTPSGEANDAIGHLPMLRLEKPGRIVERSDHPLQLVTIRELNNLDTRDLRGLGACTGWPNREIEDLVFHDTVRSPKPAVYRERWDGRLWLVEKQTSTRLVRYWLDPEKGFSPVRVRSEISDESEGQKWVESRSSLMEVAEGVWYPEAVECLSSDFMKGERPYRVVRVLSAHFNGADDPKEFSVADIGVESGMLVSLRSLTGKSFVGKWDGEKVLPVKEFLERLRKGEVSEGPEFLQAVAKSHFARKAQAQQETVESISQHGLSSILSGRATAFDSLWEPYVREFIRVHELRGRRAERAWIILSECQRRAKRATEGRVRSVERLMRKSELGEELSAIEEKQLRDTKAAVEKLLRAIFEEHLEPRLNDLLSEKSGNADSESRRNLPGHGG